MRKTTGRDGFQGWSARAEAAWERIFGGRPPEAPESPRFWEPDHPATPPTKVPATNSHKSLRALYDEALESPVLERQFYARNPFRG